MPTPEISTRIQTQAVPTLARPNVSRRCRREFGAPLASLAIEPKSGLIRWPSWFSLSVLVLGCAFSRLQADIPAPNNLVYGTITLNGQLIGSTATNFVVEARRTLGEPAVASYRMGAEPANGNYYLLALQLEEIVPAVNPLASLTGQSVFLVVRDPTGDRANLTYKIVDRGSITRVDFGTPGGDSDQDGLPDAWELAQIGSLIRTAGDDPFQTGASLLAHFIDGTDPKQPNDTFHLIASQVPANTVVTFLARQASGPGYEGLSRHYALEYSTSLLSGSWISLPGVTNILGDNSVFEYQRPASPGPAFFRGRVWLQSP